MFTSRFQKWVRRHALRLAAWIGRLPVTPNQVTVAGMLLTFASAALVASGHLLPGGVVLAFAGTFDILDGALARATNRTYPYGAFFDSTLDRYSEGAIYVGIAIYFLGTGSPLVRWEVLATLLALAGSFLVSYVRARAQSLGFKCDSGFFARPERVFVTVLGLVFGGTALTIVILALAVLTNFTVVQRIWEVWGQAREHRRPAKVVSPLPGDGGASPAPTRGGPGS
jgi:CDP-diacylglycerol--glycerol-3-phosphate 3-phosphatidyltransferase